MAIRRNLNSQFIIFNLAAITIAATGCSSGTVSIVPFGRKDIPPNQPLIGEVTVTHACYGETEDGQLVVALQCQQPSIFSDMLSVDWAMTFVLEGMPAGKERLYQIKRDTIRSTYACGLDQRRSRSAMGALVLHRNRTGTLTGRFHVTMLEQRFNVLTGWSGHGGGSPRIVVGRFRASKDDDRAQAVSAETEEAGFPRSSSQIDEDH